MSFEPDNIQHEIEQESILKQILNELKKSVYLLEIIANVVFRASTNENEILCMI